MIENLQNKLRELSNKQKIIIFVIALIIVIFIFLVLYKFFYADEPELLVGGNIEENLENNFESSTEGNEVKESKIGIPESKKTITVHVIGEVNTPGVVTLEEGSRIIDAINLAGGKTEEADLSKINLAYVLEDGVQIYIPSITETAKEGEEEAIEYIREGAGEGIITTTSTQEKGEEKEQKVNINTANISKLQTLPGIGESIAQRIIEYREQNGEFKNIEDLKNVSGIGENKFNNIKDKIII